MQGLIPKPVSRDEILNSNTIFITGGHFNQEKSMSLGGLQG